MRHHLLWRHVTVRRSRGSSKDGTNENERPVSPLVSSRYSAGLVDLPPTSSEDGIPEILAEHRLDHEVPGMRGLYAHTSDRMREDLKAALQCRASSPVDTRRHWL